RRAPAHARQGLGTAVLAALLRGHGRRCPPHAARRWDLHVSIGYDRSRPAQAEATPPLRGGAHGHDRGAGGRPGKPREGAGPRSRSHGVSPAGAHPSGEPGRRHPRRGVSPPTRGPAGSLKERAMGTRVKEILSWYSSETPGTRANLARML